MTGRFASNPSLSEHQQMTGRIYSVGYEGLNVGGLIDRLVAAKVTLVIDVRLNPISRKPGFSKKSLKARLEAVGIEYRHEAALGNPPMRGSFRHGDGKDGRRRMRQILKNGSGAALEKLIEDAQCRYIAVLCFGRRETKLPSTGDNHNGSRG